MFDPECPHSRILHWFLVLSFSADSISSMWLCKNWLKVITGSILRETCLSIYHHHPWRSPWCLCGCFPTAQNLTCPASRFLSRSYRMWWRYQERTCLSASNKHRCRWNCDWSVGSWLHSYEWLRRRWPNGLGEDCSSDSRVMWLVDKKIESSANSKSSLISTDSCTHLTAFLFLTPSIIQFSLPIPNQVFLIVRHRFGFCKYRGDLNRLKSALMISSYYGICFINRLCSYQFWRQHELNESFTQFDSQ